MTKTRALANGLEIKPGETVKLKPGSYRILMLGLKEPFQLGQKVNGTLVFEKAGTVESSSTSRRMPEPPSVESLVPVRGASIFPRARLRALCRGKGSLPLSCCSCLASRAGRTMPGRCDRRWGWSRTHHFSSEDPDQCPAPRTKCQPSARPACNHHRKESERPGRSLPRSYAHRCSGSAWPIVPVRWLVPNGGLMGVARFSCRGSRLFRGQFSPPRRRGRARGSRAAVLPVSQRVAPCPPGEDPAVNSSETTRISLPVPLTNRKSFCRKFVPGKRNGEIRT